MRNEQQQRQNGGDPNDLFCDLDDRRNVYHIDAVKVVFIENLQTGKKQQQRQHQHIPAQRQLRQPTVGERAIGQPEQQRHQQQGDQKEEKSVADDDGQATGLSSRLVLRAQLGDGQGKSGGEEGQEGVVDGQNHMYQP